MGRKGLVLILSVVALGASTSLAQGGTSGTVSVNLSWDPSPGTNVTGYFLYYGPATASYTQRFNVGKVTQATILGLSAGTTNYFVVTAYDAQGQESVPSNETSYIAPGKLETRLQPDSTLHLLFAVAAGHSYDIQSSEMLPNWSTLTTVFGQTNNIYDFVDTNFTGVPQRFYRLILH